MLAYSHHMRASRMKNYIKLKLMSLQHREINTAHDNIRISKVKAQMLSLINHIIKSDFLLTCKQEKYV